MDHKLITGWLSILAAEYPDEKHIAELEPYRGMRGPDRAATHIFRGVNTQQRPEPKRKKRRH